MTVAYAHPGPESLAAVDVMRFAWRHCMAVRVDVIDGEKVIVWNHPQGASGAARSFVDAVERLRAAERENAWNNEEFEALRAAESVARATERAERDARGRAERERWRRGGRAP